MVFSVRFSAPIASLQRSISRLATRTTQPRIMNGHSSSVQPPFEKGWPAENYDLRMLKANPADVCFPKDTSPERQEPVFAEADAVTKASIEQAASHLRAGNLVAIPTETVYGLGANAKDPKAVAKIFRTKGRPSDNPLIVHVSDMDMLKECIPQESDAWRIPDAYKCLMEKFWPGSMTLLFPVRATSSSEATYADAVTCGLSTVGIRMPSHPVARALIYKAGVPVAAPSSNASGRPSPTTAEHVGYDLGGALDDELARESGQSIADQGGKKARISLILDGGPCDVGLESTVMDGVTVENELRILRPGGITVEDVKAALQAKGLGDIRVRVYGKDMERSAKEEEKPSTPGMKYKHYSPSAKVILLDTFSRTTSSKGTLRQVLLDQMETTPKSGISLRIGLMTPSDSPLLNTAKAVAEDAMKLNARTSHPAETLSLNLGGTTATMFLYDLGPRIKPKQVASRLFAGLRQLDEDPLATATESSSGGRKENGCDIILVEAMPAESIGLAFMNRLEKAASESIIIDAESSA